MLILFGSAVKFGVVVHVVRVFTPIVVLLYSIKVITTLDRLHGLMFTYLMSSIVPLGLLAYEVVFDPISQHALSESRGGGFRLSGPYADMFNYLAYIIGDFLILGYLLVRSLSQSKKAIRPLKIVVVIIAFAIGVQGLKHQATWIVFIALILLTALYTFHNKRVRNYIFLLMIPLFLIGPMTLLPTVEKLFSKEIRAYSGEGSEKKVLNGRLVRWESYFAIWSDSGIAAQLVGVTVGDMDTKTKVAMTSGGMHSDYVRFLFTGGILGLSSLLLFYLTVFFRRRKFGRPEQFLIISCVSVILLYSVTTNVLGGSGSLLYLLCAGIAMSLQSPHNFYQSQGHLASSSVKK